jgi:hypothetical protein
MRYALLALMLLALLAGCAAEQPAPLPTAAGLEPTADTAATTAPDAAAAGGEATPLPPLNITVPPPGVIVTAAATAEPPDGPGFDTSARFESLIFQQTGGPDNLDLLIEIAADGSVRRDGAAVSVAPEAIAAVDQKLKEVDFFNIQGQFTTAGGPGSDQYRYRLSVQQDGAGRSINAQDGYTPPMLLELFGMIAALGDPAS